MKEKYSLRLNFLRSHVGYTGDDCVIWPYATMTEGYGVLKVNYKNIGAHKKMCELAHGPAPVDKPDALHSCSNKPCINPNHLRWGTQSENNNDYYASFFENRA